MLLCGCSDSKNGNDILLLGDDTRILRHVSDQSVSTKPIINYYCYFVNEKNERILVICVSHQQDFRGCNSTSNLLLSNGKRIPIISEEAKMNYPNCISELITGGAIGVTLNKQNKILSVTTYQ